MNRQIRILVVAGVAAVAAVGCKKSIPEPWNELGFTTEGLLDEGPPATSTRVELNYKSKAPGAEALLATGLLRDFGDKLKAKGYTRTCTGENRFSDGDRAFLDGYEKAGEPIGVIAVFGNKPKVQIVVTKTFKKDPAYGNTFDGHCKPI